MKNVSILSCTLLFMTTTLTANVSQEALLTEFQDECFALYDPFMMEAMSDFSALRDAVTYQHMMDDSTLTEHLQQGLAFCRSHEVSKQDFEKLDQLNWNFEVLRTPLNDLDYTKLYDNLKKQHPNLDPTQLLFDQLRDETILRKARYIDDSDNRQHNSGNDSENDANKIKHLKLQLDAYANKRAKFVDKGLYQLFQIALALPKQSETKKVNALQIFLHGGAHCLDAKRDAIETVFKGWIAQDELVKMRADLIGVGFKADLNSFVYNTKLAYVNRWLNSEIEKRHTHDQSSVYAATWDYLAKDLGLSKMGSAYPGLRLKLDAKKFYDEDGGRFTMQNFYKDFVSSEIYQNYVEKHFGPLMILSKLYPQGHPIALKILTEYGFFVKH